MTRSPVGIEKVLPILARRGRKSVERALCSIEQILTADPSAKQRCVHGQAFVVRHVGLRELPLPPRKVHRRLK